MTTNEPERTAPHRGGLLFSVLAFLLAAGTIAAAYCLLRWAPSPVVTTIVVVSILLVILAAVGFLGAHRGQAAPFVVVALLLPYLIAAAAFYGGTQRAVNEIAAVFDTESSSADAGLDEQLEDVAPEDIGDTEGAYEGEGEGDLPLDGPCVDVAQFDQVEVGMAQAEVDELLAFPGTPSGGGAGGFTQAYPDCAGPDQTFYITFNIDPPFEVAEMRHQ